MIKDKIIKIIKFIEKDFSNWYTLPERLDNRELMLKVLVNNPSILYNVSDRLKNDLKIVHTAVKNNGLMLMYASNELRCNFNIVLVAVKNNGLALKYTGLRNNVIICLEAVKNNSHATEYFGEQICSFIDSKMSIDKKLISKAPTTSQIIKVLEEEIVKQNKIALSKIIISETDSINGVKINKKPQKFI